MLFTRVTRHPVVRWFPALLTVLVGFLARVVNVGFPGVLKFDEHFYVPQAYTLGLYGIEKSWPASVLKSDTFDPSVAPTLEHTFITSHGPLGKWIIWLGEWAFGVTNPFGWRITAVLAGTAIIVLTILVGWLLTRSVLVGTLAGVVVAVDPMMVQMSRTAMLDIFLAMFALAGVTAIVLDRRQVRHSRKVFWRPWLLVAGAMFGAAIAVKLTGAVFLAVFGVYAVVASILYLRSTSRSGSLALVAVRQVLVVSVYMIPAAFLVWLASWTGYILSSDGMVVAKGMLFNLPAWVPEPIAHVVYYQQAAAVFESGITETNRYASPALTWLFDAVPVRFAALPASPGAVATLTTLGNPILWWFGLVAICATAWRAVTRRINAETVIALGLLAGLGPWFLVGDRTVYQYYAVVYFPFVALAVAVVAVRWWRGRSDRSVIDSRVARGVLITIGVLAIVAELVYLPVLYGLTVPVWYADAVRLLPTW